MHVEATPSSQKEWNDFTLLHEAMYRKIVFLNYALSRYIGLYARSTNNHFLKLWSRFSVLHKKNLATGALPVHV
jgi:hypothetical protein